MEYTDKDRKIIADYLIKRDRLERQKKAEHEAADGNNQLITPFATKIKEQSLHVRQQLSITDVMNSIAPSDRLRAAELHHLGINPNEIIGIITAQRPKEFASISNKRMSRKIYELKQNATIYYRR